MRSLELTLTVVTLSVALRGLVLRRPGRRISPIVGALPAAIALVQVVVEGARWQLAPAWIAAGVLLLLTVRDVATVVRPSGGQDRVAPSSDPAPRRWPALTATTLTLASGGLLWALPVIELPDVRGPYAVGTSTVFLTDEQRMEIYGPDPGTLRQLPVQIWYPAAATDARPARWFLDRQPITAAAAREVGFPAFALDHLSLVESHAVADAPIAQGGPFPVVVYAHGWRGFRDIHASQLESLASHGYIVAAADHTYAALATVLPGGVTAELDPAALPTGASASEYDRAAADLVETFAADLELVLDAVLDGRALGTLLAEPRGDATPGGSAEPVGAATAAPRLEATVDAERVGLIGHSTGGGAAYLFCSRDRRCDGVVGYDPWVEPVPDEVIGGTFDRPLLSLSSEEWDDTDNDVRLRRLHAGATADEGRVRLAGTLHRDLTLLPTLSPVASWFGLSGTTPAWDTLAILDDWTVRFLDHHLVDRPGDPLLEPFDDDRVRVDTSHHLDSSEHDAG